MSDDSLDPLGALADLPAIEPDRALAQRTRGAALAAFEAAHGGSPWMSRAVAVWSRVLFPVVLASCVGLYLTMVIQAASSLYQ